MSVEWDELVPSTLFTRIKTNFSDSLKKKYKMTDKNFSSVGSSNTPAVFPFVRLQLLPGSEIGEDLEGDKINAEKFSFQIDVTDNKSQARAKEVIREVKRIMKTMRFRGSSMPTQDDTKDTYRQTARFSRTIGKNDVY